MLSNKEVLEMIRINDECKEFEITNNIKATYFVDREGNKLSFGYDKYSGRTSDHRTIFGLIDGIERNDFKGLIDKTGLLVYMPEGNEALFNKDLELSHKQKLFLKRYNVELILE